MVEFAIVVVGVLLGVLLSVTGYAALEYHRRLRMAQKEYEKARGLVEDIVLSFNREIRREDEKIDAVEFKVEDASLRADSGLRKMDGFERRIEPLEEQVVQINAQFENLTAVVNDISEANVKVLEKIPKDNTSEISAKLIEVEVWQEKIKSQITTLEEKIANPPSAATIVSQAVDDPEISAVPVMPIKRDKAMASLTETEVKVLEFLSAQGPKTAPEIKQTVNLSREHTARLMKKLYEEGYLERETGKLPFKYSIKKEMENLLGSPQNPTP
ncbi:MAG: MarR family transcriptional regulator [Candidatus Bathyarchaeota archaeon]|nr:MarR family transcriptional regulator [Candidatus Bathyarchaeota archaeon]